jgi:hypothetical protein
MTAQPAGSQPPQDLLFTPGARLGWTFTDRRARISPYQEVPPDPQQTTAVVAARQAAATAPDAGHQLAAARPPA